MKPLALNPTANTKTSFTTASIHTSINIAATPAQVWTVFSDFEAYPNWNPFLAEISGEIEVGNTIKINAAGMKFSPEVLVYQEEEALEWIGRLLFKGIFDGRHYFRLHANSDGTTTFEQGEYFSGFLIPIFKGKMLNQTKANFEAMNAKLKEIVETKS